MCWLIKIKREPDNVRSFRRQVNYLERLQDLFLSWPDREVVEKRRRCSDVRKKLHDLDIRFSLAYPATLCVTWRRERKSFEGRWSSLLKSHKKYGLLIVVILSWTGASDRSDTSSYCLDMTNDKPSPVFSLCWLEQTTGALQQSTSGVMQPMELRLQMKLWEHKDGTLHVDRFILHSFNLSFFDLYWTFKCTKLPQVLGKVFG